MQGTFVIRWSVFCLSMAAAVNAACGEGRSPGFGSQGSAGDPSQDAGTGDDDAHSSSSSSGSASGSGSVFMSAGDDGGSAGSATDCMPGTYSGPFTTQVFVGDAGPGPLALMWTGTLTVTLVGQMETTTGGELPTTMLTIAPGGRLAGMDNFGGSFGADVTGQLDCSSKKLEATISNGLYLIWSSDAATIPFGGTANGIYAASTPPALNGTIYIVTSNQGALGVLGATGMVTAKLQ
jgi:hypothetical protein